MDQLVAADPSQETRVSRVFRFHGLVWATEIPQSDAVSASGNLLLGQSGFLRHTFGLSPYPVGRLRLTQMDAIQLPDPTASSAETHSFRDFWGQLSTKIVSALLSCSTNTVDLSA